MPIDPEDIRGTGAVHEGERRGNEFVPQKNAPEFIVQRAHERNVAVIELWVTDPLGGLHVVMVPRESLAEVLEDGFAVGLDLARRLAGGQGGAGSFVSPELYLVADPMSFQVIARSASARPMARLICDIQLADGSPYPLCVRSRLKGVLGGIASEAVTFYVGATMTHRWLSEPTAPAPLCDPRRQQGLADQTAAMLDALAIPWRSHSRQSGASGRIDPSCWSFELDGVDPLTLSDGLVTLRRLALTQAHAEGCGATWMPHPWEGAERAGLELAVSRVSSADGGLPSFGDPMHASGLSLQARAVAAAIASEIPALSLVLRGTANSYTRPDPIEVVAAPMSRSEAGASLVLRGADACTNPYVALALTLAIAHRAALSPHVVRAADTLPQTLVEAARAAEVSRVMADVLGGELVGTLIASARRDAARWRSQVTAFEVERYL